MVWSASDAPEPPISCISSSNSLSMGVLNWPGFALGLLVTAGSQVRASPTRSYVACASVATDERPSASDASTGSLTPAPRGGSAAAPAVRALSVVALAARAPSAAANSERMSAREGSPQVAEPRRPKRSSRTASSAGATVAAPWPSASSAASCAAETEGATGGVSCAAGSGPSCRGG